jgi:hypothetical protein
MLFSKALPYLIYQSLALLSDIRLGRKKGLPGANTLSSLTSLSVTKKNSFVLLLKGPRSGQRFHPGTPASADGAQPPGVDVIKRLPLRRRRRSKIS